MATYSYKGRAQYYSVNTTGNFEIKAYGGQGGGNVNNPSGGEGGKGAETGGQFALQSGETLEVVVAGAGQGGDNYGSGGGGGSFVFVVGPNGAKTPLLIAGGGGGAGSGSAGVAGQATTGNHPGSGGSGSTQNGGGGGGAGLDSNGGAGASGASSFLPSMGAYYKGGGGGSSASGNFAGGTNPNYASGGFGGGGAAGAYGGAGGGGGYSGGNGSKKGSGAQGGYSFDASTSHTVLIAGEHSGAGLVTIDAVCFCEGTLIGGIGCDVAVEHLKVGDVVITASGEHRPIRWLGHRTLDCRRHPRSREAMPVRVAAHAFGKNRPARDLLLSPGHSVCVDIVGGVLIPVGRLVNGATITQLDVDTVTYWHVELDSHDILLAENLACESYIDCGTRAFFAESDLVALGASPDAQILTTDDYCRPFKPEGAFVDMVRDRLSLRAGDLGWRLAVEDELGGLWLEVEGARIEPARDGLIARATLPANAREVRLRSTAAVPADLFGDRDERRLGLRLASLVIDDELGCRREIACTDERLADGFYPHEGTHRWTDGDARLPAALWDGCRDSFHLQLVFAGPAVARWVLPADGATEDAESEAA